MRNWIDIAGLNDIPKRGARVVKTTLGCVAIFRTDDDKVYAIDDTCPHKKGPLSEGIVHGASVTCPLHNWVFDLETGMAQGEDVGQVATFDTQVLNGRILLEASRLAARSAA
ncbi:nitrite reductase (NAD(P)H) small subunit [Sedimentitalea sp. CY04]|uniref:Nitrite reductase (NAD(P)H) small subunit n=1 Tax=Parasedimentitalea denitrificans TaxID=2211118 RepID=A0ABX0WCE7_9RHOB|nr:nitrite reductase small subunit NirD [Sedimentitalea sp. CY04]NIZ63384.1 nitrite reductase (NAD(P)H) small subunit [Sedimentitalea sp. CY04]